MSIYLRKSISAGPFRVNLSKSGIGMSTGVRGLRVGTGPRGSYVRMGRGGVYYRKTLSSGSRPINSSPALHPAPPVLEASDVVMEDVTGATLLGLGEASPSELVGHINEAAAHRSLMPLVVLLFLPIITIPLALLLRARDKARRTAVVFYDVNDRPAERFQRLLDAFRLVEGCQANWYVTAEGAIRTTQQYKTHAGASSLLNRMTGKVGEAGPAVLATNIAVPSLNAGKRSVYFLPDRILVREGRRYVDVAYSDCHSSSSRTRFIESGAVPKDAAQVGTTWKYVNKGGGPDRRYKDNRQLPIMQYGELTLSTGSGLHLVWQCSQPQATEAFAAAIVSTGP